MVDISKKHMVEIPIKHGGDFFFISYPSDSLCW